MRITTEELTYIYNPGTPFATKAVDKVNLTVEEGEFLGIIGHTGSGKSTFIQHLNGLLLPTEGRVLVGDYCLYDYKRMKKRIKREAKEDKKQRGGSFRQYKSDLIKKYDFSKSKLKADKLAVREKVGIVFQYPEYQLFAETVKDDVAFGLKNFYKKKQKEDKNLPPLSDEEIEERVAEALERVGLNYDEVAAKSPFDLSGGQKRRVAIAGVIVTKPEILVLDEPVAGLDPQGKDELFALLKRLKEEVVKTIIIVSHDMDDIVENCSKVAVFSNSRLVRIQETSLLYKDSSFIKEIGLDLPLTAYLADALMREGVSLDTDYTEENFLKAVIDKYREDLR